MAVLPKHALCTIKARQAIHFFKLQLKAPCGQFITQNVNRCPYQGIDIIFGKRWNCGFLLKRDVWEKLVIFVEWIGLCIWKIQGALLEFSCKRFCWGTSFMGAILLY
jgi:hypothetical protein